MIRAELPRPGSGLCRDFQDHTCEAEAKEQNKVMPRTQVFTLAAALPQVTPTHTHAHTCTRLKRKLKKAPNTSVPRETPKGVLTPQSLRIMGSISLRRDLKII